MKYKGYTAVIEIDEDSGLLFGHVLGLRDGINFQGETVAEARRSFHDSVDCYLEFCASRDEKPEKPYSGRFMIRIESDLHRALVHEALARGVSLNHLVASTLSAAHPPAKATREARASRPKSKATKPKPAVAIKRRPAAIKVKDPKGVSASG